MADKIYDVYHQEVELTREQEACLKYTGSRTLMVKGFAGAGKSLVLMAIARKYLEKYGSTAKNEIGVFTFQNTLVSTMREFLQVNGQSDSGVVVSTINSYINEIYEKLIQNHYVQRRRYPYSNTQRIDNVKKALSIHQTKYGKHRFHDVNPEFWLDEFDWMKEMNVWTNNLDFYLTIPRKGRGSTIRMKASDRVVAYQIFTCYCEYLEKTGQSDWADQTLFVIRHPNYIPEDMKFDHVLIDEAQDLSMAQMMAIMMVYKTDMVVAMDVNQKIHRKYWSPKLLGFEATTKKLTKSMRTTKQIEALAESLRSINDKYLGEDDKGMRAIPEREGRMPTIVHLDNQSAEKKYVIELVKAYLKENSKITIGIIAARKKQLNLYSDWLASEGIPHEQITKETTFSMAKPGVKVVTAYSAKGLEFNCVIIPMFAEGYFPTSWKIDDDEAMTEFIIQQRNLVYVSMTRAKNLLTITFWGNKGSRFIGEMNPSLYEWKGDPGGFVVNKMKTLGSTRTETEKKAPEKKIIDSGAEGEADLKSFLRGKGIEVIDKRYNNGALWAVGDKNIEPVLKESRRQFGALWTYCARGGRATTYRPSWFTKSSK